MFTEKDKTNMEQREWGKEDNQKEIARSLLQRRLAYTKLPENNRTQQILNQWLQNMNVFTTKQLDNIANPRFLEDLAKANKEHPSSSPFELSHRSLKEIVDAVQKGILNYKDDIFPIFHDFAFGMSIVASRLIMAASYPNLQPQLDDALKQLYRMKKKNSLFSNQIIDQTKKDRLVLEKDTSGFSLVDSIIESQRSNPLPTLIPTIVIAGAEATGKMYKKIYPIAKQVLESKA